MSHEKVTVDEPLISTDVDQLIRTLAERKKVALNELRQTCRIDRKTMDKWIAVLEDEGYISIEYGLGGTYVIWKENGAIHSEAPKEVKPVEEAIAEPSEPEPLEPLPETEVSEAPVTEEVVPEETAITESEEKAEDEVVATEAEPEPEELLRDYLARKKDGSADIDSVKSNILTSLKETGKDDARADKIAAEVAPEPEAAEPADVEAADEVEEEPAAEGAEPEPSGPARVETMKPAREAPPNAAEIRQLMNSYLAEINREKAHVEALKKERENLYREKFATLEGKMQADIVVLTEKILEKQAKIAELKERVLELPDKVDELEKVQSQLDSLRREGREALERTKRKAQEYVDNVSSSRGAMEGRIGEIDDALSKQNSRLKQLESITASLDSRSSKLKETIEDAKSQVETLNSTISALATDLQQVEQAKGGIRAMTEEIKGTVAAHGEELEALEQELDGIARMEQWVEEYVGDYEAKVEDIESYVARGDEELAQVREAAESLYMKKYLGELAEMAGSYDAELGGAVSKEKEIEQKISASSARISELVRDSQEMIRKLRGDVNAAPDYDEVHARIKDRTAQVKTIVAEKRQERAKLVEDSSKTRKTRTVSKVGKLKRKVVPLKKKRK